VFAAGSASGGDPDVAELLLKKAKKAFSSKDYREAEHCFRRAVREMSPFPEARFGLAEALEKLDRPREALDAYRDCVGDIEANGDLAKWRSLRNRAQQAVTRLLGRSAELVKLNDAFIRECLDFAKKHASSDPQWAREAYETVLRLDPANMVAKGHLAMLPKAGAAPPVPEKPEPAGGGFGEPVLRAELWSGAPEWSVGVEAIVGDSPNAGKLFWLEGMPLEGRFSVRGTFRVARAYDRLGFGVFFGSEGREPWWGLFFRSTGAVSLERCEEGSNHQVRDTILDGFDVAKQHTIQLDVRPGDVVVSLDGKELFEFSAEDRKTFDGKICLYVQNGRIEWTSLEVRK
jgi:hypothetical protein